MGLALRFWGLGSGLRAQGLALIGFGVEGAFCLSFGELEFTVLGIGGLGLGRVWCKV